MSARAFRINDGTGPALLRAAHPKASKSSPTRYRIDVIAAHIGDVVGSAGGWLFDRAMAGWDVGVVVFQPCDVRPLQILGARTLAFDSAITSIKNRPWTQTLAVAVDTLAADARVRELVLDAFHRGAEVTFWGGQLPAGLDHRVDHFQHRLSAAARAFKSLALEATAVGNGVVGPTENYRSRARWCSPTDSDLTPDDDAFG